MSGEETVRPTPAQAEALCTEAAMRAGASETAARALARSVVEAEAEGNFPVGLAHFPDYLAALREGRLDGQAEPVLSRPAPALILSDARGGAAHPGFDLALDDLAQAAKTFGCAAFAQKNAFTCGELGRFALRLAEQDLVALAATNGPALMAAGGAKRPVFCTNPLAFAAPVAGGPPLLFDQSSSATAFVAIRRAAERGEKIPPGWALDAHGAPTTDAGEAVRGALLAFGGTRGANIALMVEVLAAGLTGASWSLDAPSFSEGERCPATGLFVLALAPALFGDGFEARLAAQSARLAALGVHLPGRRREAARMTAERDGLVVPAALLARIKGERDR